MDKLAALGVFINIWPPDDHGHPGAAFIGCSFPSTFAGDIHVADLLTKDTTIFIHWGAVIADIDDIGVGWD